MDELKIVFESRDEDTVFNEGRDTEMTWKELRLDLAERIINITPALYEKGIRKVEVGSIGWFYLRKKTRGRVLTLNTMFVARLLKR